MPSGDRQENQENGVIPIDNPVIDVHSIQEPPGPVSGVPDPIAALSSFAETVVLAGLPNAGTREAYRTALTRLFGWMAANAAPFDRATVLAHLASLDALSASTRNTALAAAKKLAREAHYAGRLAFETRQGIQDIKGTKANVSRPPNWLTKGQLAELLAMPGKTLHGLRDRALLATIAGCGLRRAELCSLTVGSLAQRSARWVFIVRGKGNKLRMVVVPNGVKVCIDEWLDFRRMLTTVTPVSFLFVPVLQGDNLKERRLNEQSIYNIVKEYGERLGIPTLAPHDLRRTNARLSRESGADMEQIQTALGHESADTTKRYIGSNQNFQRGPGDMIDVDWTGKEGKE